MQPDKRTLSRTLPLITTVFFMALTGCSPTRGLESLSLLIDVAVGQREDGSRFSTVERQTVAFDIGERPHVADMYQPALPARAKAVVVPGLAPAGKDDPRLVAFAGALASARLLVLAPDIPNMRRLETRPEDADAIGDAVLYLSTRGCAEPCPPVMLVAFSYAVGPAVLAALRPDVRDRIGMILGVGGYYDIDAVVTFFTTGNYRTGADAPWLYREPNIYGKWVFARSNARSLANLDDRATLYEIADRKLQDPDIGIEHQVSRLRPEGRSVLSLLLNEDPEMVPALVAELPPTIRRDMAGLDLKTHDLSRLRADLLLIHGRDDAIIPYTESLALAAALPPEQVTVHIVERLAHVGLAQVGPIDSVVLWRAAYNFLSGRDVLAEQ